MGRHVINVRSATPDQIRRAGIEALIREPGVAGMLRFMEQYEPGHGDYTKERAALLGNPSMDELFDDMEVLEREERRAAPRAERKRKGKIGRQRFT